MSREDRGIERARPADASTCCSAASATCRRTSASRSARRCSRPRLGAAYRINEKTVFRAGYGQTFDPIPWSRPLRGFYPLTIGYSNSGHEQLRRRSTLASGIPAIPLPDLSTGVVPLPRGRPRCARPNPNNVDRGRTQQCNVTVERQLPRDISVSVGLRRHAHGRRLRGPEPELLRAGRRQRRTSAVRTGRHRGHPRSGRPHQAPLQRAAGRGQPSVQGRPAAEGCLHAQQGEERDGRRRLGGPRAGISRRSCRRNFALAGYDRTHNFQMGFLYDLPVRQGLERTRSASSSATGR